MDEQINTYISESLELCRQLLGKLDENEEDIPLFFGGEIYRAYKRAIDIVRDETTSIQSKIKKL